MKYIVLIMIIIVIASFYFIQHSDNDYVIIENDLSRYESAVFAGGCFWCVEASFEKIPGVFEVQSGYTNGNIPNPTYSQVVTGNTGHREAVIVYYLSEIISYDNLLEVFWMNIDPTDDEGQFADRGSSYRTAIFYGDEQQKEIAEKSLADLNNSGIFDKPIVTEIIERADFYQAEIYHQDYYIKNSETFGPYRLRSPRAQFTNDIWGDEKFKYDKIYQRPSDSQIKEMLSPLQYEVTQLKGTEPPFDNLYYDNVDAEGIYVDIVSGEPLFSSQEMFLSGTGWPSFTKPLVPMHLIYKTDNSLITPRIEVRSKFGDSHLGHVFTEESELPCYRYCINSAALRFVSKDDLEKEGYSEFVTLFN